MPTNSSQAEPSWYFFENLVKVIFCLRGIFVPGPFFKKKLACIIVFSEMSLSRIFLWGAVLENKMLPNLGLFFFFLADIFIFLRGRLLKNFNDAAGKIAIVILFSWLWQHSSLKQKSNLLYYDLAQWLWCSWLLATEINGLKPTL